MASVLKKTFATSLSSVTFFAFVSTSHTTSRSKIQLLPYISTDLLPVDARFSKTAFMASQSTQLNSEDEESNLVAVYAGAKCQIAALEQQLQNLKDAGTKHKW
jgi:hypothetical protein